MSSDKIPMNKSITTGIQTQAFDASSRLDPETSSVSKEWKENDNIRYSQDEQERHARAKTQKEEIQFLREQITLASVKERQLLNEKYTLERKFAELRLALDEKQNEAIASASNELARRKGDLEENLRLAHELKVAEDERYIFMSSLVGLLAEYGISPPVTNAIALSDNVKYLHDQMQQKIRESQGRMGDIYSEARIQARNGSLDKDNSENNLSLGQQQFSPSPFNNAIDGRHQEPIYGVSRYTPESEERNMNSLMLNNQMNQPLDNDNQKKFASKPVRQNAARVYGNLSYDRVNYSSEEMADDNHFQPHIVHDEDDSLGLEEDGPGIEGFQIIGDARPGGKLLGCGFPVRGTSLCMFQWVRHLQDGTREYIEGATNPEYVVTADDVDKLVAVECIPMDDQGRQGEIVRLFANDQNKITCDPEMQQEIDRYISVGQASFSVLLLMDSSENWEQTLLSLRRSSYQIKVTRTQEIFIHEKYSNDLSIKIPPGLTTQLVLTCSDGSSHPFNTYNDVRMRDTLVLTMRMFQSKALDERRKGKA